MRFDDCVTFSPDERRRHAHIAAVVAEKAKESHMRSLMPLVLGACAIPVNCTNAQTLRDVRYGHVRSSQSTVFGWARTDQLRIAAGVNVVEWVWRTPVDSGATHLTLPRVPFAVGTIRPTPDRERYLLCGVSGTTGVVGVVRIDPVLDVMVLEQHTSVPRRDILDVYWNAVESRVYVLSGGEQQVLYAPWPSLTLSLPTVWTTAVGAKQVTLLETPQEVLLGEPPQAGSSGFGLRHDGPSSASTWVRQVGSIWVPKVCTLLDTDPQALDAWVMTDATHADVRTLRVQGRVAGAFTIVTQSNVVVGSGEITAPHQPVDVPLSPPRIAGAQYRVTGAPLRDSAVFRPAYRYGLPLSIGGVDPGRVNLAPSEFYVGSTVAPVSLRVNRLGSATAPASYAAALWMAGTAAAFANPPIVQVGNVALLIPDAVVPVRLTFKAGDDVGKTGWMVTVPADLNLQGALLWFQFLIAATDHSIATSDVVATSILLPPPSASRSSGGVRSIGSRAAQAWVRLDGEGDRAVAERRRVLDWTRRVWRQLLGR